MRPQTLGDGPRRAGGGIGSTIPLFTHWPGLSAAATRSSLPVQGERRDASGQKGPSGGPDEWESLLIQEVTLFGVTLLLWGHHTASCLSPILVHVGRCSATSASLQRPHRSPGRLAGHRRACSLLGDWVVHKGLQVLLPAKNWYLSSASTRIKSQDAVTADLQCPWEELRVEIWNEALCLGQNWRNKSSASYFQEMVLWAQSLRIKKSTKIINADICSSQIATFCKMYAWLHVFPFH